MATTTNFSVRMDSDIKKQCEAIYGELGINLTTAINVFLRQSLRVGGFPFDVRDLFSRLRATVLSNYISPDDFGHRFNSIVSCFTSSLPVIRIVFVRSVKPETSSKRDLAILKRFASKAIKALFALPSTGGALTAIFK